MITTSSTVCDEVTAPRSAFAPAAQIPDNLPKFSEATAKPLKKLGIP
jgi:hypothetical protein